MTVERMSTLGIVHRRRVPTTLASIQALDKPTVYFLGNNCYYCFVQGVRNVADITTHGWTKYVAY
jgi:hypothetical protein